MQNVATFQRQVGDKPDWDSRDWITFLNALYLDTNNDIRIKPIVDRINYEYREPNYREKASIVEFIKAYYIENNVDISYLRNIVNSDLKYEVGNLGRLLYDLSNVSTYIPTLQDIFGANLKFYIDTEKSETFGVTGMYNSEITGVTSHDTTGYTVGTLTTQRTIYNGHSLLARDATYMLVNGSTSAFNFLHENTPSTIALRIYPIPGMSGNNYILNNENNQTTTVGISLILAGTNITYNIRRGVSGQTPITATGPAGSMTAGAWHDVIIKDTGTQVTVWVDGVAGTPVNNAFARAVGAASYNMYMFRIASTGTYANNVCVKRPMFFNKITTTADDIIIRDFLKGNKDFGHNGVANVYGLFGQSNMSGRGDDFGNLPSYLLPATGAQMFNITNNVPEYVGNQFAPHLLGTNVSTENQTYVGPDLEFAYRMNLAKPGTIYLIKYATTGSSMKLATFPDKDWNYTSSTDDNCYRAFDQAMVYGAKHLKYILSKEVRIKGFLWRQGESDTTPPNDYYETDFSTMLTGRFKTILEANGFNVTQCRIIASSLDIYIPVRGQGCQDLVDATQNVINNAVALGFAGGEQFTSVGDNLSGDDTHFNVTGYIKQGNKFYLALKDYL